MVCFYALRREEYALNVKLIKSGNIIYSKIVEVFPKVAVGLIVFLMAWCIAIIVRYLIRHFFSRSTSGHRYLLQLLGQIAYVTVLIVGGITALGTIGINVTALVTGLGLTGFAIGFALKDMLSNTLAGFLILFYEPFHINERITVSNVGGKVIDINLRYTILQEERKQIMVPNATVIANIVTIGD